MYACKGNFLFDDEHFRHPMLTILSYASYQGTRRSNGQHLKYTMKHYYGFAALVIYLLLLSLFYLFIYIFFVATFGLYSVLFQGFCFVFFNKVVYFGSLKNTGTDTALPLILLYPQGQMTRSVNMQYSMMCQNLNCYMHLSMYSD